MTERSAALEYREGGSDKIYDASVEKAPGDLYVVNFSFGPRNGWSQSGTKTNTPVPLPQAIAIFNKLVDSKTAKGYVYRTGGMGLSQAPSGIVTPKKDKEDTGLRPQLLNPITEAEAETYISDKNWGMQEKFDGKRVTIRKVGKNITAANKKGQKISISGEIEADLKKMDGNFEMDGEAIGNTLMAFDLLSLDDNDLRSEPYSERYFHLTNQSEDKLLNNLPHVKVAKMVYTRPEKTKMMADLRKKGKEGVVFKSLKAVWTVGRPASGGCALKMKFWESCSAIVLKVNAKRSIQVTLEKPIGNVTISPNFELPAVGDVVEIRYLYVANKGGSLYQPIYLGKRDDVSPDECTFAQQKLKYRDVDVDVDVATEDDDNDEDFSAKELAALNEQEKHDNILADKVIASMMDD